MEKIKLFCLPYAGGASMAYQVFTKCLPEWMELIPYELPGHGRRFSEELVTDMKIVAKECYEMICNNIDDSTKYAILGHSMGTAIALEVERLLEMNYKKLPLCLFLSAGNPLCIEKEEKHHLGKEEFMNAILDLGGIPDELASNEEMMDIFYPIIRADITMLEKYRKEEFGKTIQKVHVPLYALCADSDCECNLQDEKKWALYTDKLFLLKVYEGTHFYLFSRPREIMNYITDCIFLRLK